MEDHLTLVVLIESVAQAKVTSVTVTANGNEQAVETILEGLAGKTQGAGRLEISGNWAVALQGLEFDFFSAVAPPQPYYTIQIPVGDKSIVSKGWFSTAGISQSVNASTEATCTFIGELNALE